MGLTHRRSLVTPSLSLFFISLSYSLFQASSHLKTQRSAVSTYLPGFLRPEREGALRLHSLGRPGGHLWPYVDDASLLSRDFIDFLCIPRNISLFSFLLYFLICNILSLSLSLECTLVVDSCQCMAKPIQYCKVK